MAETGIWWEQCSAENLSCCVSLWTWRTKSVPSQAQPTPSLAEQRAQTRSAALLHTSSPCRPSPLQHCQARAPVIAALLSQPPFRITSADRRGRNPPSSLQGWDEALRANYAHVGELASHEEVGQRPSPRLPGSQDPSERGPIVVYIVIVLK